MSQEPATAAQEWKKHWLMVLAAMVGMSFYSVITYSLGTFIGPIESEFGWNRTEISFGLTIFALISMFGGPFIGAAIDKFGTRTIATVGMFLTAAAFAAFSLANGSLVQWYGLYVFYGIVALTTKSTIWSAGVSSVFSTSRSLALAVMLSGSALGQTFAPIIANWLIEDHGWRAAYIGLGVGWGGLGLILVALFFVDARELGRRSTGAAVAPPVLPGLTVKEATRDSRVIRIAIANLFMSMVGSGVTVHLVPLIAETGLDKSEAVQIAALAGIAGIVGKLGVGAALDRFQGSLVPFLSFAVAAIGHLLLLDVLGSAGALALGSMALGFSAGAGLQVSTYLISRYAGLRNFGTIFGTIASMMMAGMALGPLLAGYIHDIAGSYEPLLLMAAPTMLLAAAMFIGLGPYPVFKSDDPDSAPRSQPAAAS
ncbi:MAG: MFS transporter [Novosphingobium sp.]|nr:MFS transporter [Novosphingobium sp.]